ncbi:hypothetical protein AAT19DRAFT_11058 [Rhodotorula toruloides]|uniref:Uncharacterized protein n=1 Tax=Rhodotorula toruloides TaxID=5286 RepID=A0A2S9ZX19_RHOTO|nr:hypothetical protein AAT19DRAFT_11058 [Rhodotorula toruloides]
MEGRHPRERPSSVVAPLSTPLAAILASSCSATRRFITVDIVRGITGHAVSCCVCCLDSNGGSPRRLCHDRFVPLSPPPSRLINARLVARRVRCTQHCTSTFHRFRDSRRAIDRTLRRTRSLRRLNTAPARPRPVEQRSRTRSLKRQHCMLRRYGSTTLDKSLCSTRPSLSSRQHAFVVAAYNHIRRSLFNPANAWLIYTPAEPQHALSLLPTSTFRIRRASLSNKPACNAARSADKPPKDPWPRSRTARAESICSRSGLAGSGALLSSLERRRSWTYCAAGL